MKRIKRSLKSKKGSSVLEFALGLLIFVTLAGFVVDAIIIANKQHVVSQTANQLVRQIGVQGGVKPAAPAGYPGGDRAYMDAGEMTQMLEETFGGTGIERKDWSMTLKGFNPSGHAIAERTLNSGTNFEVDYRNLFEFEIKFDYNWTIMGQIIPLLKPKQEVIQKRSAVSEFKYAAY